MPRPQLPVVAPACHQKVSGPTMTTERTSILARLTADIMEEKKKVNKTLTPVAGEAKPAPIIAAPTLPSDLPGAFMSAEGMTDASRDLRRYAVMLVQIADGIDVINGVPDKVEAQTKREAELQSALEKREEERLADEKAKTPDFRTLQKAAQEALDTVLPQREGPFNDLPREVPVPPKAPVPQAVEQWTCPEHGVPGVVKTSAKGREYIGCPECKAFQR